MKRVSDICIDRSCTVRECMEVIDRTKVGIALVVDETGRLVGTVTDGDIRRYILAGNTIHDAVSNVMWTQPISQSIESTDSELINTMKACSLKHLPILDKEGRPFKIVTLRDLLFEKEANCIAIVMAGGEGKRLRPITDKIPKPMVKVAGKPILEIIIGQLVEAGINSIYISLNYKAEIIENYYSSLARTILLFSCQTF